MNIIIASNRPFPNRDVKTPSELDSALKNVDTAKTIQPNLTPVSSIFFPYWSWKVPKEITDRHICIGFHTGDINGGHPIQNLIKRGVHDTRIRMFRLNDTIDGGEIIAVAPISLLGSLEEIIIRQTEVMREMINDYIHSD